MVDSDALKRIEEHLEALVIIGLRNQDTLMLLLHTMNPGMATEVDKLHNSGGILTESISLDGGLDG